MAVVPAASVGVEALLSPGADILLLIGKWFTFWGIGIRLLIAGLNQSVRPHFTASDIFGIEDPKASAIVRELGAANLAMGLIATLSLAYPGFLMPSAIAGGLFLAVDAVIHFQNKDRDAKENIAMVTDAIIPVAVIVYLAGALG